MQVIHLRVQVDNILKRCIHKKIQPVRMMHIFPPALWLCFQLKTAFPWTKESQLRSHFLGTIKEKLWPLLVKGGFLNGPFPQLCKEKKWAELGGGKGVTPSSLNKRSFFYSSHSYNLFRKRSWFVWFKNSLMMYRNEIQLGFYCI